LTSIIEKRLCLHKQLTNQKQLNQALKSRINKLQSLSTLGTATCMIAHEINNLLTPLTNYAQLALNNPQDRELAEKALRKTVLNCERSCRVLESMLAMTAGHSQTREKVKPLNIVEQVFECLCRDFSKDGIVVEISIPPQLEFNVVPVQIQQVFMNLILNARTAMLRGGGILKIEAKSESDLVLIKVSDSGCGIEPAFLDRIFEPFFSIQQQPNCYGSSGGAGLGLALCKELVEAHNGTISVESVLNQGTTFTITLPQN